MKAVENVILDIKPWEWFIRKKINRESQNQRHFW